MPSNLKYALLVIDVQDSFQVDRESWAGRSNPHFERNVKALIDAFEQYQQTVIYIIHHDDDVGFRVDDAEARLSAFLNPRADDLLLRKNTRSSFASTDLDAHLQRLQIDRLVICGIQTEQCCETTTRHAADLGYSAFFVTEATRTFPLRHWREPDVQISTDEITERTEYVLANRFAEIMDVATVLTTLRENSNS